jgi:hypothetical protein
MGYYFHDRFGVKLYQVNTLATREDIYLSVYLSMYLSIYGINFHMEIL